jgi:hypothetical protein
LSLVEAIAFGVVIVVALFVIGALFFTFLAAGKAGRRV